MTEESKNEDRVTISLKRSTADKLNMLKRGRESWEQFLTALYPVMAQARLSALQQQAIDIKKICDGDN